MKRVRIVAPERIVVEDVEVPRIGDGDVLVATKYCGICGSEIHAYLGRHPFTTLPIVPGHECSGVVADVGKDVSGLSVGQRVTVIPQITCGRCYNCRIGRYNICKDLKVMGFQADGVLAEYFAVKPKCVVPLLEGISLTEATLIEPFAVAVHAVRKSGIEIGSRVAILGAGTIGLSVLQCARLAGASDVVVTDIYDHRLRLARGLGADHAINVRTTDPIEFVRESFGAEGIDLVFECVGVEATVNQAIQMARKGTRVMVIGVFERDVPVKIGLVQDRELELVGSLMYSREDFRDAMRMMRDGELKAEPLISRIYGIDQADEAFKFAVAEKGRAVKVLVSV
ncbi:TPA: alcohol dehydrogenase [Candidatus Bathyarchaeota archaeon]|nr:alcohol dehydrogenase [Candidatus Bathyarchaeota archaeon]